MAMSEWADKRLRELAEQLDSYSWAAELLDDRWRVVWVSGELQVIWGETDAERLGYGRHFLEARMPSVGGLLSRPSAECWLQMNLPFMLHAKAGDTAALGAMMPGDLVHLLQDLEPREPPPRWVSSFDFARGEFFGRVAYVGERVHDERGDLLGYLFLYTPDVPVSLISLLSRGDRRMYERMAALVEPGPRSAAVLFADLEASGALSRRLPSAVYFRLIRSIRTALEAAAGAHGGILGKHAGDGVTAFFLAEQLGGDSQAARAALETGRALPGLARDAASQLADDGLPVDATDCQLNVAVHWGASLYIGQVATEGRLEVTALGDEVNEAARIEQSAKGGRVLASKPVLERLRSEDISALGVDPTRVAYELVAELEGASAKAGRDAGSIAVADISGRSPTSG
jgi:class 3 adenylate cyclase